MAGLAAQSSVLAQSVSRPSAKSALSERLQVRHVAQPYGLAARLRAAASAQGKSL
jgi:hypothetical protein